MTILEESRLIMAVWDGIWSVDHHSSRDKSDKCRLPHIPLENREVGPRNMLQDPRIRTSLARVLVSLESWSCSLESVFSDRYVHPGTLKCEH